MDRVIGRQLAAPYRGHPNHTATPAGSLPSLADHNEATARLRYKLSGALSLHNVPVHLQAKIFDFAQLWYCFCTTSQDQRRLTEHRVSDFRPQQPLPAMHDTDFACGQD